MHTYSRILQFRSDTIRSLIFSERGFAWALRMFVIVLLIAGLGRWFGLGPLMRQSTLVESFDSAIAAVQGVEGEILGALNDAAAGDLAAAPVRLSAALQQRLAPVLGQLQGALASVTNGSPVAGAALPGPEAQALARLTPLLDALDVDEAGLRSLLAQISVTPEQLDGLLGALRVSPDWLARRVREAELTAADLNAFLLGLREQAVEAQPPLGVRPSRAIRLAGDWLDTPLEFAASWLFFILALLLAARSLGGSGSLRQHLTAALLASAPGILLLGLFVPPVASAAGLPIAVALHVFTRLIALIGVIWCIALLVKTLATAHGFTHWRALGALALTAFVLLVVAPLFAALALGFLLPL